MPISLKPHNVEAYQKVKEKIKESNKVAVVHPTGTGKMFIALKLIEENSDKKAIYVAPSNIILHDVKKNIFSEGMTMEDFPNLKRITYQKLMNLSDEEIEKLGVDIIILDEFHHCGAPEWGRGVERLMQSNPNASILGLSATPLRYTDGLRDMADELFENNVASEMTLEQAIEEGILPEATYVSALDGYDEELERLQTNVDKMKDEGKKVEAQELLNNLRKKLDENTKNLPELFQEHMQNKNGKYIVFCKNIDDMNEKIESAQIMFGKVNPNIKVRAVSSKIKESDRILTEFEQDTDEDSLKLLFAVDMLNEGYHAKDLDGVIMMRPTFSPAIYKQQLGRALAVGGEKRPVVLDLVNNFDSCKIIADFVERMKQYKVYERKGENNEKIRLSIFDKTKEFREIVEKIDDLSKIKAVSAEEKIKILEEFAKTGEEIDGSTIYNGYPIGYWAIQIRHQIKRKNDGKKSNLNLTKEQIERLKKIGILQRQIDSTIDEKIESLIEWLKKYPKARFTSLASKEILKEYAETEEEYKHIEEEYEKMRNYYKYIRERKSRGNLYDEQIAKCKEGNIGGRVFGYPTFIEELAKKYRVKESEIDYIILNYRTIENFYKSYRRGELNNEREKKLANLIVKDIIDIDGTNNPGYNELMRDIIKYKKKNTNQKENKIIIYSSKSIMEYINSTCDSNTARIIERIYDLTRTGDSRDKKDIAKDYEITTSGITNIFIKFIDHIKRDYNFKKIVVNFENLKNEEGLTPEEIEKLNKAEELLDNISLSKIDISSKEAKECLEFIKNISTTEIKTKKEEEKREEEKSEQKIPKITIEELDFSSRTYNALKKARIYTLEDLLNKSEEELWNLRNVGKKSLMEVIEKIHSMGYSIRYKVERKKVKSGMEMAIEELKFSTRTYNALNRARIYTLGDLLNKSENELRNLRNMGNKSFYEVIEKIHSMGYSISKHREIESEKITRDTTIEEDIPTSQKADKSPKKLDSEEGLDKGESKEALVEKILIQQQKIAEQQNEIAELRAKLKMKNEK